MAEPQKKTHQTNPRSSCFLRCFGFSGKKKPIEKPIQTGSKNKTRSLSWPMFRLSVRKFRTKTVPVDNTEKAEADSKSHTTSKLIKKKSDSKLSPKPRGPTNHKLSRQNPKADQQLASPNQASRDRPKETTRQGPQPEPNIILRNRKLLDPTRTGSSLPGSPKVKPKPKPKTPSKLSHTVSLPVLEGNQRVGNPRIHAPINLKEQLQRESNEVVEKFDPVMGMSIIMVTLIIMLLWGRLCAILFTSALLYFCPRFRTTINTNDNILKNISNSNNLDLDSDEYKKKVVLEGLLERNHRVTL